MLTQTDKTILTMLNYGLEHKDIALSLDYTLAEYHREFYNLLSKTGCWDEIELCRWWLNNKNSVLSN